MIFSNDHCGFGLGGCGLGVRNIRFFDRRLRLHHVGWLDGIRRRHQHCVFCLLLGWHDQQRLRRGVSRFREHDVRLFSDTCIGNLQHIGGRGLAVVHRHHGFRHGGRDVGVHKIRLIDLCIRLHNVRCLGVARIGRQRRLFCVCRNRCDHQCLCRSVSRFWMQDVRVIRDTGIHRHQLIGVGRGVIGGGHNGFSLDGCILGMHYICFSDPSARRDVIGSLCVNRRHSRRHYRGCCWFLRGWHCQWRPRSVGRFCMEDVGVTRPGGSLADAGAGGLTRLSGLHSGVRRPPGGCSLYQLRRSGLPSFRGNFLIWLLRFWFGVVFDAVHFARDFSSHFRVGNLVSFAIS